MRRICLATLALLCACDASPQPPHPLTTSPSAPSAADTQAATPPPQATNARAKRSSTDAPHTPRAPWRVQDDAPRYTLTARPDEATLKPPRGPELALWPALEVALRADTDAPTRANLLTSRALDWSPLRLTSSPGGAWTLRAQARAPEATYTLTLEGVTHAPLITARVRVNYHRDVLVQREVLRWPLPRQSLPQGLSRAYTWSTLTRDHHSAQASPRQLAWPALSLIAHDAPGLWVRTGSKPALEVELDHVELHPFKRYDACPTTAQYPSLALDETPRRAGESTSYTLSWLLRDGAPLPLPSRFPAGHLAAIAFTDHADQGSAARTEALTFGHTGALSEPNPTRGMVSHGLSLTKTIFLKRSPGYQPQLDDPAFAHLVDAMRARGVAIGLHSVSGATDTRHSTREALREALPRTGPLRTWIDHQPNTNCEALSNQGWDPSSPYYMLDLLQEHGTRTLWAVHDVVVPGNHLNMLSDQGPARRPVIYPHARLRHGPEGAPPLVFNSAWFFIDREALKRRFADANLDRLQRERGLLLAHTYLDNARAEGKLANRALLEAGPGRTMRLRDDADDLFARLGQRQARRELLVGDVDHIAHHLYHAMRVRLLPAPDGLTIIHAGAEPLRGFTLRLPTSAEQVSLDGQPVRDRLRRAEGLDVWFDLEPGRPHTLRALDAQGRALLTSSAIHLDIRVETP